MSDIGRAPSPLSFLYADLRLSARVSCDSEPHRSGVKSIAVDHRIAHNFLYMNSGLSPRELALTTSALGFVSPGAQAQRRMLLIWSSVLAGSVALLLIPAVWNGFPFLFYDSGAFIELATRGGFYPERSAFYAHFIGAFLPTVSLWPAVVVQVLIAVLLIADFACVLRPSLSPLRFLLTIVALSVCTGLPWKAADVLPDIWAPLLVLSLYLLGFHADRLSWPHKAVLIAVAVFACTSHASHLGLAAGLAAIIVLLQFAARRMLATSRSPRWQLPALVVVAALLSVLTSNFFLTGDVFLSRSGPSFILARLVQDGIAKRVLDDTCPQSGYRLCAYKDHLPADSNDYLWRWDSPFPKLGEFAGMEDESKSIIAESLKRYPLLNLKIAILDTLEQLVTFRTGDGIEPLNGVPVPALERHMPQQVDSYMASRQHKGEIEFHGINALQVPVGALSMAALVAIFVDAALRRKWNDRFFLPAFVLSALIGNAFICGALSSPHDRYQARLIWLAVFAVILLVSKRAGEPPLHAHSPSSPLS